jgi:hypothetical protein
MAGIVAGGGAVSAGKWRSSRRSEPDPARHPDRAQRQTFRVSRFSNGSLTTRLFPRRAKRRDILSALQPSKGCTLRHFLLSPAKRLHHPFTVSIGHHSRNSQHSREDFSRYARLPKRTPATTAITLNTVTSIAIGLWRVLRAKSISQPGCDPSLPDYPTVRRPHPRRTL